MKMLLQIQYQRVMCQQSMSASKVRQNECVCAYAPYQHNQIVIIYHVTALEISAW